MIADHELLLEEVEGFESLGEGKHVLLAVGSLEGPSHLFLGRLDPPITQASQRVHVALAGDDRAQDAHAGLARHVADRLVKLHVHLLESLVHQENLARAAVDDPFALAPVGPQAGDVLGRTESLGQKSVAVELLAPLAVQNVGLAAADMPCLTAIEKKRLETSVLQDLVHRHPVHTRGFHRHRVHAA
jgi:hypothetical protein